jgi:phosphoesterase RecJ-like protein
MSKTPPVEPGASAADRTLPGRARLASPPNSGPGQLPEPNGWEAAVELIRRSTEILLICHVSPDGDAIGSLLGLGLALRNLGKTPTLACESSLPAKFSFLLGYESVVRKLDADPFDLVIGLDSSDISRLGDVYDDRRLGGIPLINIDHHITNLYFGDVNVVNPGAASTAEMVLTLLDQLGISIDQAPASSPPAGSHAVPDGTLPQGVARASIPDTVGQDAGRATRPGRDGEEDTVPLSAIATCLLTGIVTDTLGFRTSNVTPHVMAAALRLMQAGASLPQVTYHAFHQRPLAELSLLALGLNRLQAENGMAWSEILLADRQACGFEGNSDVGLVGMLARTQEVHIAAVFSERENNQVEISFRADPGFDVAQLALSLGGGGHPAASGCTIEGPLEAAKARVLPLMRTALEAQQQANRSPARDGS